LIFRFFFLDHSSIASDTNSTFVDQHIQAGQDMFARSQEELSSLIAGGKSGVEKTNDAIMDDETAHLKRRFSDRDRDSDSDL
jgi:hypothetical protein